MRLAQLALPKFGHAGRILEAGNVLSSFARSSVDSGAEVSMVSEQARQLLAESAWHLVSRQAMPGRQRTKSRQSSERALYKCLVAIHRHVSLQVCQGELTTQSDPVL